MRPFFYLKCYSVTNYNDLHYHVHSNFLLQIYFMWTFSNNFFNFSFLGSFCCLKLFILFQASTTQNYKFQIVSNLNIFLVVESQEKPWHLMNLLLLMYMNPITKVSKETNCKIMNWQLFCLKIATRFLKCLNLFKTLTPLLLKMSMLLIPKDEKKTSNINVNDKFQKK